MEINLTHITTTAGGTGYWLGFDTTTTAPAKSGCFSFGATGGRYAGINKSLKLGTEPTAATVELTAPVASALALPTAKTTVFPLPVPGTVTATTAVATTAASGSISPTPVTKINDSSDVPDTELSQEQMVEDVDKWIFETEEQRKVLADLSNQSRDAGTNQSLKLGTKPNAAAVELTAPAASAFALPTAKTTVFPLPVPGTVTATTAVATTAASGSISPTPVTKIKDSSDVPDTELSQEQMVEDVDKWIFETEEQRKVLADLSNQSRDAGTNKSLKLGTETTAATVELTAPVASAFALPTAKTTVFPLPVPGTVTATTAVATTAASGSISLTPVTKIKDSSDVPDTELSQEQMVEDVDKWIFETEEQRKVLADLSNQSRDAGTNQSLKLGTEPTAVAVELTAPVASAFALPTAKTTVFPLPVPGTVTATTAVATTAASGSISPTPVTKINDSSDVPDTELSQEQMVEDVDKWIFETEEQRKVLADLSNQSGDAGTNKSLKLGTETTAATVELTAPVASAFALPTAKTTVFPLPVPGTVTATTAVATAAASGSISLTPVTKIKDSSDVPDTELSQEQMVEDFDKWIFETEEQRKVLADLSNQSRDAGTNQSLKLGTEPTAVAVELTAPVASAFALPTAKTTVFPLPVPGTVTATTAVATTAASGSISLTPVTKIKDSSDVPDTELSQEQMVEDVDKWIFETEEQRKVLADLSNQSRDAGTNQSLKLGTETTAATVELTASVASAFALPTAKTTVFPLPVPGTVTATTAVATTAASGSISPTPVTKTNDSSDVPDTELSQEQMVEDGDKWIFETEEQRKVLADLSNQSRDAGTNQSFKLGTQPTAVAVELTAPVASAFALPTAKTTVFPLPVPGTVTATTAVATTAASGSISPTPVTKTNDSSDVLDTELSQKQMMEDVDKWIFETEERRKVFADLSNQIDDSNKILISLDVKLFELNEELQRIKSHQQIMEQELGFSAIRQKEIEQSNNPLQTELINLLVVDSIDSQLMEISDDLKEISDNLIEENADTTPQIGQILNDYIRSSQWIDVSASNISKKLDEITKLEESFKRLPERSFRCAYFI